ncbi:MAG: citrate:proton symporter [Pseudomonadota bacterium]|nr:citrate:proton symporter [Pseudomonadota bacterium]
MLAFFGLLTVVCVVGLLLARLASPIVALVLVPLVAGLVYGFSPEAMSTFFGDGLARVMQVATMFIFAIIFFGVLQDTGFFRPFINGLIRVTRGNVVYVAVGTTLVGACAHLDGAGATTFLLTVPALLPLYLRLGMSRYLLLMLLATGAGIANMLPWAGPLGRAAAVTGIEVTELWRPLIPVQLAGIALLAVLAVFLGLRERRRIAAAGSPEQAVLEADGTHIAHVDGAGKASRPQAAPELSEEEQELLRPRLIWLNAAIFLAVLTVLVAGILPAAYTFMIGLSVLLTCNYRSIDEQMKCVRSHSGPALLMGAIILSAGSFLGVLDGSGMLKAMAEALVDFLPSSAVPMLHIVIGFFGLPLELVLNTDAYYFGLLPVVLQVVEPVGVTPQATVYAMIIGNIIGTFISPFSPAMWLALGLAQADIGRHIRYSLLTMWGFSIAVFGIGWALGLF